MSQDPLPHDELIDPALAALVERAGSGRRPAPVERWTPPFCGDIDLVITGDGRWHYAGTPIGREALVRLFATILAREPDGRYVLVTPAEKVGIRVEDVPFLAVEMHAAGSGRERRLIFRTNVGDVITAGPDHPLRFAVDPGNEGLMPYVHVRRGLEARLTRAVTAELADLLEEGEDTCLGVWSSGVRFVVPG